MEPNDIFREIQPRLRKYMPLPLYDGDKVGAIVISPDQYEAYRQWNVAELKKLMDKIAEQNKDTTKEEIMDILEIDEEEYHALFGGGQ